MTLTDTGPEAERRFSTFEVAKACGVFHTTVINWVNKGKLKAILTPGGHRRIPLRDLVDFMRRFDMPIPPDLVSRPKRALVVEDDAAVRRMLLRALARLPEIAVESCSGGMEALIAIGREAPELLVLDIRIPEVDGLKVLRLLRSNELSRPIKIIAVSGENLDSREEALVREHADGYLRKPLSPANFLTLAAECLGLQTHDRALSR